MTSASSLRTTGPWNARLTGCNATQRKLASATRPRDEDARRGPKTVVATFLHDTSRSLDSQRHLIEVLADKVREENGKRRTMANVPLYRGPKLIGMIYRNELAAVLKFLGYEIGYGTVETCLAWNTAWIRIIGIGRVSAAWQECRFVLLGELARFPRGLFRN